MTDALRGIATLAVLKTRFDEGRDHLGLFEPFVADAVANHGAGDFVAPEIAATVRQRTGLVIPANTVQTLLGRLAKKRMVQRVGGRYLRTKGAAAPSDLSVARTEAEGAQARLAEAFLAFSGEASVRISDRDEALAAIAAFISDNKVPLLLEEQLLDSPLERSTLPTKLTRTIARFITQRCLSSPELHEALDGMIAGLVLRDTLLLSDIADLGQRFRNLVVVLDSPVLFAAIDLAGVSNGVAAKEGLALLRSTGSVTIAFDRTVGEMRRILAVYEGRVATAAGRLTLHPTDLTHHVLSNKLGPSDIRTISATLERRLAGVGVTVRDLPRHDRRYTLDEETLAKRLADRGNGDFESPRIRHDIDCIAGVLTMRAGHVARSFEDSRAVFCTTTGLVVRSVQQWYSDQREGGVPPIVHQLALTNIAWLKQPAAAPRIKTHELAAVCAAALRPKRSTWERVLVNLRQLRQDGSLDDDETVAVLAGEFTEPLIAQIDEEHEPDADTILEAIERVRMSYREDADRAAAIEIEKARAEATVAQESAAEALTGRDTLLTNIESRTQHLASALSSAFYWICASILISSAVVALPGVFDEISGAWKGTALTILAITAAFGVISWLRGVTVASMRTAVRDRVASVIRRHLYGLNESTALGDDRDQ